MIYSLYQYTCRDNGKRYIGVTNNVARRQRQHLRGQSGADLFYRALLKHGADNFDFRVLAVFDDVRAAAYHELAAITKFGTLSPDGYNLFAGAPGTEYAGTPSVETLAKLSAARKRGKREKYFYTDVGMANLRAARLGRVASDETRAKLRERANEQFADPRSRSEVGSRMAALWADPEYRAKQIALSKARWADPAYRAKVAAGKANRRPSD